MAKTKKVRATNAQKYSWLSGVSICSISLIYLIDIILIAYLLANHITSGKSLNFFNIQLTIIGIAFFVSIISSGIEKILNIINTKKLAARVIYTFLAIIVANFAYLISTVILDIFKIAK
ncbi:MAG: hypothetical protein WCO23_03870 [bacterium]